MKKIPYVTIIGRPNVGKSTLFNRLVRQDKAIVHDMPGVTRDRLYGHATWDDITFGVIDTAGLVSGDDDAFISAIVRNAEIGMEEGDVILFMVDSGDGLLPDDHEIANILRKKKKQVIVIKNKSEKKDDFENFYELYALGFDNIMPISAKYGNGMNDLIAKIIELLPRTDAQLPVDENTINIAIIGRPNVGKSTLLNAFLGEERSVVSDVAGTTRDAIDALFVRNKQQYNIVDTAGIRRKSKVEENLEHHMVMHALKSVDTAHVVIFLIDGTQGLAEQDEKILGYAHERGIGIIMAVNKWDLVEKDEKTYLEMTSKIQFMAPFLLYAPILFISAKDRKNLFKLIDTAKEIYDINNRRIGTGEFNRFLEDYQITKPHPVKKRKRVIFKYGTQVEVLPPKFILFTNNPDLVHFSYERQLKNALREKFGFTGCDIKLEFRGSSREKE